jgi:hypothetical protein
MARLWVGEIRREDPSRPADFLVTWQIRGFLPSSGGATDNLVAQSAATLTFTPEKRECAGTTFVGFRVQFQGARSRRDRVVELGGTTRGLSYFDGYRGGTRRHSGCGPTLWR